MHRGIALMLQGAPQFAWQLPDGTYRPCRQIAQLERFEAGIFDGTNTPGFYAIRPGNFTRWGALDFDNHDGSKSRKYWLPDAQRAFDCLASQLAERWLVESSPGGFHVIGFADALLPAADVRRILLEIAPTGVEVFPKQDALDTTKPNAKGSLLRFPGRHQRKGTWARFIACSGRVQDADGIAPAPKPSGWQEPTPEGRLRSLYVIATRGIEITGQGQRFHAMQRIAGRLKGRASEQEALWVYTAWHNRNADKIGTPFEESRKAFLAWFNRAKPCNATVPKYPRTEDEEAMIASLPKFADVKVEHLAAVVGLLLDAERHAKGQGLATFWRSCRELAANIGTSESTAKRVRSAAAKALALKEARAGSTGYATEFEVRQ
jgi:hypothetical protein